MSRIYSPSHIGGCKVEWISVPGSHPEVKAYKFKITGDDKEMISAHLINNMGDTVSEFEKITKGQDGHAITITFEGPRFHGFEESSIDVLLNRLAALNKDSAAASRRDEFRRAASLYRRAGDENVGPRPGGRSK